MDKDNIAPVKPFLSIISKVFLILAVILVALGVSDSFSAEPEYSGSLSMIYIIAALYTIVAAYDTLYRQHGCIKHLVAQQELLIKRIEQLELNNK